MDQRIPQIQIPLIDQHYPYQENKGALFGGGDILKMKENALSEVNLATKNH